MKIGILTLPLHYNYGGILQAYALQTILERMGHKVKVIDKELYYPYRHKTHRDEFRLFLRHIAKRLRGEPSVFKLYSTKKKEYFICRKNTDSFISKYIHRYCVDNLSDIEDGVFDCFIVGSDQIWRPKTVSQMWDTSIADTFLKFATDYNGIRRIAYAPSFGVSSWDYSHEETEECRLLLQKFDIVTVREADAVKLCKDFLCSNVQHVLDPTMLLDKNDYVKLVENADTPISQGNLLVYILDRSDKTNRFVSILKDQGYNPFTVNSDIYNLSLPMEKRIQPPVEQWLRGFMDADMIITDSFHACVFSIIFNKPFWVVGNNERGMSRFHSLLSLFGLESRLVLNTEELRCPTNTNIDWNAVNKERSKFMDLSINILEQINLV